MPEIGPYHPSREEEVLPPLPEAIPDGPEDQPGDAVVAHSEGTSPIILGCAVFGYGIYSNTDFVQGGEPLRVLRYALRSGINAFDTSPWYHPSEIVMGRCLERLRPEYPRGSYKLITKVGKYGPKAAQHSYDRETVLASVERSLKRLRTDYLDVVYLHDVEFVTSSPSPSPGGNHVENLKALTDASYPDPFHLRPPHKPLGPGDENILEGLRTLSELRSKGVIRKIGMAALPLPLLLRLSLLAQSSGIKIDIIQTYSQHTILTPILPAFIPHFQNAGISEVTNAAPLAMGLLTTSGGPDWHPARTSPEAKGMYEASREACALCEEKGTKLELVALDFGLREIKGQDLLAPVPVVVGCKNIDEIKRTVINWNGVNGAGGRSSEEAAKAKAVEDEVIDLFEKRGVRGLNWSSPTPGAL